MDGPRSPGGKEVTFKTAVDISSPRARGEAGSSFSSPSALRKVSIAIPTQDSRPTSPYDDLKLPNVVNFVALRETFLSEAPFIKRNNRGYWKRWIDSKQYINMLAASLRIICDAITDTGSILMQRLYQIDDSNDFIVKMAMCLSEMLVMDRLKPSRSMDNFTYRLPELLVYMIINAMQSLAPKLSRIFFSVKFREVLLDWLNELIGGVRITTSRFDKEWLFKDANDVAVVVLNGNSTTNNTNNNPQQAEMGQSAARTMDFLKSFKHKKNSSAILGSTLGRTAGEGVDEEQGNSNTARSRGISTARSSMTMGSASSAPSTSNAPVGGTAMTSSSRSLPPIQSRFGAAKSVYTLDNSPLVRIAMNLNRNMLEPPYNCSHSLKMTLSQVPEREILPMQPECLIKAAKHREKRIDSDYLQQSVRQAMKQRSRIEKQVEQDKRDLARDNARLRLALKLQLELIEKKQKKIEPTQQEELAAANAMGKVRFSAAESNT